MFVSTLMMIFMLITAIYISKVDPTTTLVLDEYRVVRGDLQLALQKEFASNFKQWNAVLLGDMTIRFNNPNIQFASGSSELRPEFQELLKDLKSLLRRSESRDTQVVFGRVPHLVTPIF